MTRGTVDSDRALELVDELSTSSDRAVAILGGAIVEACLSRAIIAHLHKNEKVTSELFKTTGALGAFTTKIHLGLLIGMYGDAAHKELLIIKDIRNRFAHSLEVVDFETQQIAAWCMNLTLGERYTFDSDGEPPEDPNQQMTPIGAQLWWLAAQDRDARLEIPRERFLLSVDALTYGLALSGYAAMPEPKF